MNTYILHLCVGVVALTAICPWHTPPAVAADDVHYSFDFNDGLIPASLEKVAFRYEDDPTQTITCDASGGELRIYDTASASCGLLLYPEQVCTDVHVFAVIDPVGLPSATHILHGRDMTSGEGLHGYGCYLFPVSTNNNVWLGLYKAVNGQLVFSTNYVAMANRGPYLLQLDVVDREQAGETPCTEFSARLTYNDGLESVSVAALDYGMMGNVGRFTSGRAAFGAFLHSDHCDRGWILDATFDDVTITGTPVGVAPLAGDLNADGLVNSTDLDVVRANWGQSVSPHLDGDADGDGFVGAADLDLVRANWGTTAAVPEPPVFHVWILGAALFFRRPR